MNASNIHKIFNNIGRALNKNSPTILTGLGVVGLATTVILAVKATPKALYLLQEEKDFREKAIEQEEACDRIKYDLDDLAFIKPLDQVKIVWKCYIPTVTVGAMTIACIIGANTVNLRRNAALASLYSMAEVTMREYQDKVIERIGKTKEEKIRGDIAQDKLDNNPVDNKAVIITGKGDMLCYDTLSGRYFKGDIETLRRIENEFNKRLLSEMRISLNELYFELGLESISLGDSIGWDVEKSLLSFSFSAKIAKDGQPCIVIDHKNSPVAL